MLRALIAHGLTVSRPARSALAGLLLALSAAPVGLAQSPQDKFHRAYYLETADRNLDAAARLYAEVAADTGAPADLKSRSQARLAAVREDLAATDLARLMPPDPLAYIEVSRPGEQIERLLGQLGLLAASDSPPPPGQRRVAVSPALVRALLGMRGAGVAVTGFDPAREMPTGVLVIHPGDLPVKALCDTLLPIAGKPTEPVEGFAAFEFEGDAHVTVVLTSRLIIAGNDEVQVAAVCRRLKGVERESLATNAALTDALQGRDGSLLFFCVNARPLMPLIQGLAGAGAMQSREMAIANALLDLRSLKSLSGRMGISEAGVTADLSVTLEDGHHNLVYNLLRLPPVDPQVLAGIPEGVAACVAFSLNEAPSRHRDSPAPGAGATPAVTLLDIGREVFANIVGVAAFALPPGGESPRGGPPIPDVAAVFTVNDPSRSRALWTQFLGIASLATGVGAMDGEVEKIEGADVHAYRLPERLTLYFVDDGNHVIVSPSRMAIARALAAKRSGKSVVQDAAYSKSLSRLGPDSTVVAFAHPARCFAIARSFMPAGDAREVEPFVQLLSETVASLVVTHGASSFRLSASVTGLPKVDGLIAKLIEQQMSERQRFARQSDARGSLERAFAEAARRGDEAAARSLLDALYGAIEQDALALNNFAWNLVENNAYEGRYTDAALRFATRANEHTGYENWMFVDTLAWAHFRAGNVVEAVELERRALDVCRDRSRRREAEQALARFEDALRGAERAGAALPGSY